MKEEEYTKVLLALLSIEGTLEHMVKEMRMFNIDKVTRKKVEEMASRYTMEVFMARNELTRLYVSRGVHHGDSTLEAFTSNEMSDEERLKLTEFVLFQNNKKFTTYADSLIQESEKKQFSRHMTYLVMLISDTVGELLETANEVYAVTKDISFEEAGDTHHAAE